MPEETTTTPAEPQAGSTANSPQPQAGASTTPEPQAGDGKEAISLEEAKKLRSEAANLRKRLKSYEDAEQAAKDAELGELERSKKQFTDLQAKYDAEIAQYKQELIATKVQLAAKEKGIIDSELAAMAIQKSLEFGDDGMPTNIDKALDSLIKNKPYLAPKTQEPTQQAQETPSQTATQQKPPVVPAMNPGRGQINPPSGAQQQGPYRPPSWNDIYANR